MLLSKTPLVPSCSHAQAPCPAHQICSFAHKDKHPVSDLTRSRALLQAHDGALLRHRGQLVVCQAGSSGRTAADSRSKTFEIPETREQAIAQACEALSVNLQGIGKKTKPVKGFKAGGARRLAIEIPVADESPSSVRIKVVSLAEDLLKGLPPDLASAATLVFGSVEAALLASSRVQNAVVALDDPQDDALVGPLLVMGPSAQQVPDLAALFGRWRGKEAILVNAGWTDPAALQGGSAALAKSFETVYCFQPIALQAFVITTHGAIFRQASRAQPMQAPWQILKKKGWGNEWRQIGQMARRPGNQELENAFANASASDSPITAGLKAVRQLVPGKKD